MNLLSSITASVAFMLPVMVSAQADTPPLLVVYFLPSDVEEPHADYVPRLDRVLTNIQKFYADEMERLDYGRLTFSLERDDKKELIVHVVQGRQATMEYDRSTRNSGGRMVEQTRKSLREQDIEVDGRVLLLVAPLLVPEGEGLNEVGPYQGGGNHAGGTAWIFDHPKFDTELLKSNDPGAFYHGPCTWGRFNTIYIGGTAHELGHAFGLPHVKQAGDEASRGTALMGAGNFTYGEELRGQGKGSFLTRTSANILAGCRAFVGELEGSTKNASAKVESMTAQFTDGVLTINGKFAEPHDVVGLSIYNDPARPSGDYDALGYFAEVGESGEFTFTASDIKPGKWQLRYLCRHKSGVISRAKFDYDVNDDGEPDVAALNR